MKRRYVYSILVGVPGLIVSLLISAVVFGMAAGALWLFVFGDNPWPPFVESSLPILFVLVFLVVWLGLVFIGFLIGKRLEPEPALNRKHVLASAAVTVLGVLFILFYQLSVGNIGPKSPEARCADFCGRQGYGASSVSSRISAARTCGCLNGSGQEIITVPLDGLDSSK
jgi:hypothetical protein